MQELIAEYRRIAAFGAVFTSGLQSRLGSFDMHSTGLSIDVIHELPKAEQAEGESGAPGSARKTTAAKKTAADKPAAKKTTAKKTTPPAK